jgi:transposase-like protein
MPMPEKYSEALAERICQLACQGHTIDVICDMVGINRSTLYYWRKEHVKFKGMFDAARDSTSSLVVEASLYKKATGYTTVKEHVFFDKRSGEVLKENQVVEVPPDTRAAEFWLTNRDSERWKATAGRIDANLNLNTSPQVVVVMPELLSEVQAELEASLAAPMLPKASEGDG